MRLTVWCQKIRSYNENRAIPRNCVVFGSHPSIDSNSVVSNSSMYFLETNAHYSRTYCTVDFSGAIFRIIRGPPVNVCTYVVPTFFFCHPSHLEKYKCAQSKMHHRYHTIFFSHQTLHKHTVIKTAKKTLKWSEFV